MLVLGNVWFVMVGHYKWCLLYTDVGKQESDAYKMACNVWGGKGSSLCARSLESQGQRLDDLLYSTKQTRNTLNICIGGQGVNMNLP